MFSEKMNQQDLAASVSGSELLLDHSLFFCHKIQWNFNGFLSPCEQLFETIKNRSGVKEKLLMKTPPVSDLRCQTNCFFSMFV